MAQMLGKRQLGLSRPELTVFFTQISMILKSGISAADGVQAMLDDIPDPEGRALLKDLHERLDSGESLAASLEAAGVFPLFAVTMVRVGEATGKLDEVAQSLGVYYEWEDAVLQSVRSAIAYPLMMVGMLLVVVTVLLVKVMPVFNEVYRSLGAEMTGFAGSALVLGRSLGRYGLGVLLLLALLAALCTFFWVTGRLEVWARQWSASFPPTRKISELIDTGRLANAMSLMLSSGLDTDLALGLAAQLTTHPKIQVRINRCRECLGDGRGFSEAIAMSGLFSGLDRRLLSAGARAGSLDIAMKRLAGRYDEEINSKIARLVGGLEPSLVILLSLIVGVTLLSVMLPLIGIMASIG